LIVATASARNAAAIKKIWRLSGIPLHEIILPSVAWDAKGMKMLTLTDQNTNHSRNYTKNQDHIEKRTPEKPDEQPSRNTNQFCAKSDTAGLKLLSKVNNQGQKRLPASSRPFFQDQALTKNRETMSLSLQDCESSPPESMEIGHRLKKLTDTIWEKNSRCLNKLANDLENVSLGSFTQHKQLLNRLLIASVLTGQDDWVHKSLDWGAEVDAVATTRIYFGQTALMLATQTGNVALMQMLIDRGASIEKIDEASGRWHPLLIAAYSLQFSALELLVNSKKVRVDYPNEMGWTALKMALEAKHGRTWNEEQSLKRAEIIRFLVQENADPLAVCQEDYGFADMLAHHQNPLLQHVAEYSDVEGEISYPANSSSPLEIAAQDDNPAFEAILLGDPDWMPAANAAPFFIVLENFFSTTEGAKAKYLAFREKYAKDPASSRKLAQAYISMPIND
jgi:ankyrin repeat protein